MLPFALSQPHINITQNVENGTTLVLVCGYNSVEYPAWRGPTSEHGNSTPYTLQGDPSFNPDMAKQLRLSWADNRRDLILSNVSLEDAGMYACFYLPGGGLFYFIQVVVRGMKK